MAEGNGSYDWQERIRRREESIARNWEEHDKNATSGRDTARIERVSACGRSKSRERHSRIESIKSRQRVCGEAMQGSKLKFLGIVAVLVCNMAVRAQTSMPQTAPKLPPEIFETASFTVHMGDHPDVTITAGDLAKMPRHSVTVQEHGDAVAYEGVYLHDVLARAGAPFGKELRGKALSTYVLATARDGYAVVYTLTEMDADFSEGDLLVADKSKGEPLPVNQGPLRIVAAHDKKPARSLRMLDRIDVVQLRK
ncbi:MAG: molybdopterin-dependent oxidoreductase [Acidobacteriota bacterium]|nr:molybdopterin-dependent oxidoreductase [Acidobacteriota bacterium]